MNNIVKTVLFSCTAIVGAFMFSAVASADELQTHQHHEPAAYATPAPFVASTAKPFSVLMNEAMTLMDQGMANAAMNGDPDHDFAAMMIPHHQGAIDMAKVELLYGKDPVLRRLAQEIIVTQEQEIMLLRTRLKQTTDQ